MLICSWIDTPPPHRKSRVAALNTSPSAISVCHVVGWKGSVLLAIVRLFAHAPRRFRALRRVLEPEDVGNESSVTDHQELTDSPTNKTLIVHLGCLIV